MMQTYLLIPAIAMLVSAAPPSPPPPAAKAKWVINYADSTCLLSRDRSPTEPGIVIRAWPFADEHEIVFLLSPAADRPFYEKGNVEVGGFPLGRERVVSMVVSEKTRVRAVETTISVEELTRAIASSRIRIIVPTKPDVTVNLPNLGKAASALRMCEEDLAKRWKISRTWVANPRPERDVRLHFSGDDYPEGLALMGRTGSVRPMLAVSPSGSVTDCRIIETSGEPLFEQTVCKVLRKRARFTPAQEASGRPTAGYYLAPSIRFILSQ